MRHSEEGLAHSKVIIILLTITVTKYTNKLAVVTSREGSRLGKTEIPTDQNF